MTLDDLRALAADRVLSEVRREPGRVGADVAESLGADYHITVGLLWDLNNKGRVVLHNVGGKNRWYPADKVQL